MLRPADVGRVRQTTRLPHRMRARDRLVQLQTGPPHFTIAVDECCGAVGICTIEDLLAIVVCDAKTSTPSSDL